MSGGAALAPFFYHRDFSPRALQPPGPWQVLRCDWRTLGGPGRAELAAAAPPGPAGEWAALLRSPVELLEVGGAPAWWGYVAAVELRRGGARLRYCLDDFYNSVRVDYQPGAGEGWLHMRARDLGSMAEWGEKEFFSLAGERVSYLSAQATARGFLALLNDPGRAAVANEESEEPSVRLELRGWWDTLGWRFWEYAGEGARGWDVEPSEQMVLGQASTGSKKAQGFYPPPAGPSGVVGRVRFSVAVTGTPNDSMRFSLNRANGTNPSTTELESVELAGSLFTSTRSWVELDMPNLAGTQAAGELLFLVWQRTGAVNSSNYYNIGFEIVSGALPGQPLALNYGSGVWSVRAPASICTYKVWTLADTGEAIKYLAEPARGGQFLTGARVETGGSARVNLERSEARDFRAEIEALVRMGGLNGARLVAEVDAQRVLRVYPAPGVEEALLVREDGALLDPYGCPLGPGDPIAGRWARLAAWPDAPAVWIDQATYDGLTGRVSILK